MPKELEGEQMNPTDKDKDRVQERVRYDDGTIIGTVKDIHNVNMGMYGDFKKISRIYGNNEGAALSACVLAWLQNPVNYAKLAQMDEEKEANRDARLEAAVKQAEAIQK